MLAEYDRWLGRATDAALDAGLAADAAPLAVGMKVGDMWRFAFGALDAAGTTFRVSAEAVSSSVESTVQTQLVAPPRDDTSSFLGGAHAIRTAIAAVGPRDRGYTVAPLPDGSGGYWVYLYPVPFLPESIPVGADFRVHISADGVSVLDVRRMHQSILTQKLPDPKDMPAGSEAIMFQTALLHGGVEDTDVMVVVRRERDSKARVVGRDFAFEIARDGSIVVLGNTESFLQELAGKSKDKSWIDELRSSLGRTTTQSPAGGVQ
jgi:hypothetical protein